MPLLLKVALPNYALVNYDSSLGTYPIGLRTYLLAVSQRWTNMHAEAYETWVVSHADGRATWIADAAEAESTLAAAKADAEIVLAAALRKAEARLAADNSAAQAIYTRSLAAGTKQQLQKYAKADRDYSENVAMSEQTLAAQAQSAEDTLREDEAGRRGDYEKAWYGLQYGTLRTAARQPESTPEKGYWADIAAANLARAIQAKTTRNAYHFELTDANAAYTAAIAVADSLLATNTADAEYNFTVGSTDAEYTLTTGVAEAGRDFANKKAAAEAEADYLSAVANAERAGALALPTFAILPVNWDDSIVPPPPAPDHAPFYSYTDLVYQNHGEYWLEVFWQSMDADAVDRSTAAFGRDDSGTHSGLYLEKTDARDLAIDRAKLARTLSLADAQKQMAASLGHAAVDRATVLGTAGAHHADAIGAIELAHVNSLNAERQQRTSDKAGAEKNHAVSVAQAEYDQASGLRFMLGEADKAYQQDLGAANVVHAAAIAAAEAAYQSALGNAEVDAWVQANPADDEAKYVAATATARSAWIDSLTVASQGDPPYVTFAHDTSQADADYDNTLSEKSAQLDAATGANELARVQTAAEADETRENATTTAINRYKSAAVAAQSARRSALAAADQTYLSTVAAAEQERLNKRAQATWDRELTKLREELPADGSPPVSELPAFNSLDSTAYDQALRDADFGATVAWYDAGGSVTKDGRATAELNWKNAFTAADRQHALDMALAADDLVSATVAEDAYDGLAEIDKIHAEAVAAAEHTRAIADSVEQTTYWTDATTADNTWRSDLATAEVAYRQAKYDAEHAGLEALAATSFVSAHAPDWADTQVALAQQRRDWWANTAGPGYITWNDDVNARYTQYQASVNAAYDTKARALADADRDLVGTPTTAGTAHAEHTRRIDQSLARYNFVAGFAAPAPIQGMADAVKEYQDALAQAEFSYQEAVAVAVRDESDLVAATAAAQSAKETETADAGDAYAVAEAAAIAQRDADVAAAQSAYDQTVNRVDDTYVEGDPGTPDHGLAVTHARDRELAAETFAKAETEAYETLIHGTDGGSHVPGIAELDEAHEIQLAQTWYDALAAVSPTNPWIDFAKDRAAAELDRQQDTDGPADNTDTGIAAAESVRRRALATEVKTRDEKYAESEKALGIDAAKAESHRAVNLATAAADNAAMLAAVNEQLAAARGQYDFLTVELPAPPGVPEAPALPAILDTDVVDQWHDVTFEIPLYMLKYEFDAFSIDPDVVHPRAGSHSGLAEVTEIYDFDELPTTDIQHTYDDEADFDLTEEIREAENTPEFRQWARDTAVEELVGLFTYTDEAAEVVLFGRDQIEALIAHLERYPGDDGAAEALLTEWADLMMQREPLEEWLKQTRIMLDILKQLPDPIQEELAGRIEQTVREELQERLLAQMLAGAEQATVAERLRKILGDAVTVEDLGAFSWGILKGFFKDGLWGDAEGIYQMAKFILKYNPTTLAFRYVVLGDDLAEEREMINSAAGALGKGTGAVAKGAAGLWNAGPLDLAAAIYGIVCNDEVVLAQLDPRTIEAADGVVEIVLSTLEGLSAGLTDEVKGRVIGFATYQVTLTIVTGGLGQAAKAGAVCRVRKVLRGMGGAGKIAVKVLDGVARVAHYLGFITDPTNWICFAEGTPVLTPEGTRPIESIRVGELVYSRDESRPLDRSLQLKRVTRTFITHPAELMHVTYRAGQTEETLACTATHPFFVENMGQFVYAEKLRPGDRLVLHSGGAGEVVSIRRERAVGDEPLTTYNFSVEDYRTYFVGQAGVWVHNMSTACEIALRHASDLLRGPLRNVDEAFWKALRKADRLLESGELDPNDYDDFLRKIASFADRRTQSSRYGEHVRRIREGHLPEGLPSSAKRVVSHDMGVQLGRKYVKKNLGLKETNWVNPFEGHGKFGQGFDDVMQDASGNIWIVEYKGGAGKLAGGQMEGSWVEENIERLNRDASWNPWAKRLEDAYKSGKLRGIALHSTEGPFGKTIVLGQWKY